MATIKSSTSGKKRPRSEDTSAADEAKSAGKHTVYLEGLPYTASEDDIKGFFDGCGEIVDVRAPRFHDSGRLRGYAHVDFATKACLSKALSKDGSYLGGRFINVAEANAEGSGKHAALAMSSRPRPAGCTTLFIKNLPYETDEEIVKAAFARFGNVTSVRLARWNHTNRLKGFGYVQYEHGYSAEAAMKAYRASAGVGEKGADEPIQVGGRTVHLDYETSVPKQSFKTSSGVNFYKTEEAAAVKQQLKKMPRKDDDAKKTGAKKHAASPSDDDEADDRKHKRARTTSKDDGIRKSTRKTNTRHVSDEEDEDVSSDE